LIIRSIKLQDFISKLNKNDFKNDLFNMIELNLCLKITKNSFNNSDLELTMLWHIRLLSIILNLINRIFNIVKMSKYIKRSPAELKNKIFSKLNISQNDDLDQFDSQKILEENAS